MRPEAVTDKDLGFLIRSWFSLGIKHTFNLVQANLGVGIFRLRVRKIPSRGVVRSPCALMGYGWPDD